ncbi:MAG: hypothetical protein HY736_27560 [Verrucomicrobia bacterium]|nr:hypothetical protein [Verrucomicrobiota bacterium]
MNLMMVRRRAVERWRARVLAAAGASGEYFRGAKGNKGFAPSVAPVPSRVPDIDPNRLLLRRFHPLSLFPLYLSRRVRTAPFATDARRDFTITHLFHPWHGRRVELIERRNCWGQTPNQTSA